jgi:hypothetical protein
MAKIRKEQLTVETGPGVLQSDVSGDITTNSALTDGTTATTQTLGDNSTKISTTAYIDTNFYNKSEVDDLLGGINFNYFFTDTADGVIAGYNEMVPSDTGEAESTVAAAIPGADTLIKSFVTEIDEPEFTNLLEGIYDVHTHAAKTAGTQDALIYAEFYTRTSGGSETLRATSESSPLLTGSNIDYDLHFSIPSDIVIASDDRLVVKFYGTPSGAGTTPTVTLYLEGTNDSRIEVKTDAGFLENKFVVKNGLSGGQTVIGGTGGGEKLILQSTSNGSKHPYGVQVKGDNTGIFAPTDASLPAMELFSKTHDDLAVSFDSYSDGTNWRSSDAGSNFVIQKTSDQLDINSDTGVSPASIISWNKAIRVNGDASVELNTGTSINEFSIDGTLTDDSDNAVPTEKAVKTYVDSHVSSVSSLVSVVAGTGISAVTAINIPVESSTAGDTTVTATPAIVAGTDGQRVRLIGTDDTKTVTFTDGNGLALDNGQSFTLGENDILEFVYYNSLWIETSRKDN